MNSSVYATINIYLKISNTQTYGQKESIEYTEIKIDLNPSSLNTYQLTDLINKHIDDFKNRLNIPRTNIKIITRTEYQQHTKETDENKWIPIHKRLPTKEEYLENDGRFILDDGNRRYQGLFDIYDGKFKFSKHTAGLHYELYEDPCVLAWQPFPKSYQPEPSKE